MILYSGCRIASEGLAESDGLDRDFAIEKLTEALEDALAVGGFKGPFDFQIKEAYFFSPNSNSSTGWVHELYVMVEVEHELYATVE